MAYVPGFEHDIFVSYAHVDDMALPGFDDGWVTTLVKNLKILVSQSLGRTDAYSLWMDYRLQHNVAITDAVMDNVRKAATLVIILSPGYLASDWCQREKNAFLKALKERKKEVPSVFVVETRQIEKKEYPKEFKGHKIGPARGLSLAKTFIKEQRPIHEELFYTFHGKYSALTQGDWKIVDQKQLYNLKDDRIESNDRSADYPKRFEQMKNRWKELNDAFGGNKKKARNKKKKK